MIPQAILLASIKHEHQRYNTVGDWQLTHESFERLAVTVSRTENEKDWIPVAVHELVEAILCIDRGITQEEVDEFDKEWEVRYERGMTDPQYDEPGVDPAAPYHKEHMFAMKIENMLVEELGLDYDEYDARLVKVYHGKRSV